MGQAARSVETGETAGYFVTARFASQVLDRGRLVPAAPRRYLIVVPRPLPAAALVVRRRYVIVVPRPLPATPLVVCRRILDRSAQAVARGAARCVS